MSCRPSLFAKQTVKFFAETFLPRCNKRNGRLQPSAVASCGFCKQGRSKLPRATTLSTFL